MQTDLADITALVLCGGKSSRMSGLDKGLVELNGSAMILHTLQQLSGLLPRIFISANQNQAKYQNLGYPVIADVKPDSGPLAGILSAMQTVTSRYLLITPCDTPFISRNICLRLIQARKKSDSLIQVAHDGKQLQTLHALLDLTDGILQYSLEDYLETDRKVQLWYEQNQFNAVDCSDLAGQFKNINTPDELNNIDFTTKDTN